MTSAEAASRDGDMQRLASIYQAALDVESRLLDEIDLALGDTARTELSLDDEVAAKVASHGLWILARVVGLSSEHVEVEDVDDEKLRRFKIKKSDVLMLPRQPAEIAHARASYKPNATVFAMYPETTSFYKATVTAGAHISTSGDDVCLVRFDDDEDDLGQIPSKPIPLRFIVDLPLEI